MSLLSWLQVELLECSSLVVCGSSCLPAFFPFCLSIHLSVLLLLLFRYPTYRQMNTSVLKTCKGGEVLDIWCRTSGYKYKGVCQSISFYTNYSVNLRHQNIAPELSYARLAVTVNLFSYLSECCGGSQRCLLPLTDY